MKPAILSACLMLLFFTIPTSALSPDTSAPTVAGPSDPAEVEEFLDLVMPAALARYNVPGATVAVVDDGRLVVAKGYGYSDIANRTQVNAETTLFRIGSISKLFVWTAVMQLVEEGKIDLDADVNTYLKDMQIPDTYPGQPVTMRHLMTHTAGFEDTALHMTGEDPSDIISIRQYCAENIPVRILPPGAETQYSNYGTTLAAVIVEDVSGMSYDDYLQSRILTPLSMENTSIKEDLPEDLASRLSEGYRYVGSENLISPDYIFVIAPAGSISSTAPDMAKFMIAHLRDGTYENTSILSPETAKLMHSHIFSNDPLVAGMGLGLCEQLYNGRRTIGHAGDTDTFHSLLVLLPEEQTGFFVSSNSPGGGGVRNALFEAFMDHYYPEEQETLPTPDPSDSERLQKYAGTYMESRHNYAGFEKYFTLPSPYDAAVSPEGTLIITKPTGPAEYIEVQPGVFSPADGTRPAGGNVVFHTADDESVEFFALSNIPVFVYDRLPWYMTPFFMEWLKNISEIILATVFLWPLLFIFRHMHGIPEPAIPEPARFARWVAGIAAVVLIAFVSVLLPSIAGDENLINIYMMTEEVPAILITVLTLPVISGVLTIIAAGFAVFAWKDGYWTLPHRVHYTVVTIALVAMLLWVNANNLWVWCL